MKSIFEFDEEFESIRELISPKTLLALDDEISSLQEAKRKLFQRLDSLLNKVSSSAVFANIQRRFLIGPPPCWKRLPFHTEES